MIAQHAYQEIAADLRAQIAQGKLRPGDELPSERVMARQYGVARMTARQGVQQLEMAGEVTARGNKRYVAQHRLLVVHIARTPGRTHPGESPSAGADSWMADMLAAGREPEQEPEVFTRAAELEIAHRLEMTEHGIVIARRLLRRANGEPHNLITFWFPLSVAEGTVLARPGSITEGSLAWLESKYELTHQVRIRARMPRPEEAAALAIPGGVPVMIVWRVSRTAERPVVVSMGVFPADRTELAEP